MAFDPLPSPSTFSSALLTIESQLSALEAKLGTLTFSAQSSDKKITVVVTAAIDVSSIAVDPTLLNGPTALDLTTLGNAFVTVTNQALALAHTRAGSETLTAASVFNLPGVGTTSAFPNFAGFAEAANTVLAQEPALDQRLVARRFQGQSGSVTAVVNGRLDVVSVVIGEMPDYPPAITGDVGLAINLALGAAKQVVDDIAGTTIDAIGQSSARLTDLCLYARGNLVISDGVTLKGAVGGSFAAVANAGSGTTNIGASVQTGNVWSRAAVHLRSSATVNGTLKTNLSVTPQNSTNVTGGITENTFVQLPNMSFTVTFPTPTGGRLSLATNEKRTAGPGAYNDLRVPQGAVLSLGTGTYFVDSFDLEPGGTISTSSKIGQIVIYVKGDVIYHGSVTEKTGGRPALFMGCFGVNPIALASVYNGTLVAPFASVDLNTVAAPGHAGSFFSGKDVTVDANQSVTWVPFSGVPSLGSF